MKRSITPLVSYRLPGRQSLRCLQRIGVMAFAVSVLSMSFGCVRAKTVMDLRIPELAGTSPTSGAKVVKIVKVTDLRNFKDGDSAELGTPTVARSNEVTDRAITLRTVGQAHGRSDIILPEGRTVEMLVGDAVQKALKERGYSVVSDAAPSVANAIPLEVEIKKFWLWFAPGFWVVTVYYEAEIGLKSPIVLNGKEETVTGHFDISSPLAVSGMYSGTAESGLDDLIINAKAKFKAQ